MNSESGATYLEFRLDGFDSLIDGEKLPGQATPEPDAQLLEYPMRTIDLHAHRRELDC
jgi:hypothetical protein